ncbi:MAG: tetratricopeptide repeat protein [Anaerolineae bacterium]
MIDQGQLLRQVRLALQSENYQTAIYWLEQAINAAVLEGDVSAAGRHKGNLALIYYRLGQREKALECFQQALASARDESDRATEEGLLGNIGNIMREVGRHGEALSYLRQALKMSDEIDDVRGRGIWLSNLGLVYDDLERPEDAIPFHEQAIAIARDIQDMRGLAARLGNLGNSYVTKGDLLIALTYFAESAGIYRKIADHHALAQRLGVMGNLQAKIGRAAADEATKMDHLRRALGLYEETLALARGFKDASSEAELLRAMGGIAADMYDDNAAVEYWRSAGKIYRQMGQNEQTHVIASMLSGLRRSRRAAARDD